MRQEGVVVVGDVMPTTRSGNVVVLELRGSVEIEVPSSEGGSV
jgi:hypothetical protein